MKDTPEKQKTCCGKRVALHGASAVAAGIILAGALTLGLGVYAKHIDPDTFTSPQAIAFPDSQEKLEAMAAKLRGPENPPQEIEPAAGAPKQAQHQ